jgi:hypothetical protein
MQKAREFRDEFKLLFYSPARAEITAPVGWA